jgi:hypothetical protein
MTSTLKKLQDWYQSQCNEDWEHSFGIKIENVDNPGWLLTVDLQDTALEGRITQAHRADRSDEDWVFYQSNGVHFTASGGAFNLEEMLELFLTWAGGAEPLLS